MYQNAGLTLLFRLHAGQRPSREDADLWISDFTRHEGRGFLAMFYVVKDPDFCEVKVDTLHARN